MSGPNQVLDEQTVGRRVAERLDTVADRLGPIGLPDWDGVRSGLRRSVRRRRLKRTGIAAGALASVVALGGTVQLGVLPYPSWAPAVPMVASAPSALADLPTYGSLAGDEVWLQAFREFVASDRWDESGGESWSVAYPDDVKVLFAGDVGNARVAAIEAPYRWGLIEDRQQVWFVGDAGAASDGLSQRSNGPPSDVMVTSWAPGYEVTPDSGNSACMLALVRDGITVTLEGTPQYRADGAVTRPTWRTQKEGSARIYCGSARDVGAHVHDVLWHGSAP